MAIRISDNNNIPQVLRRIDEMNTRKARVGYITGDDYDGGVITAKGLARVHEYGVNIPVTDKMRGYLSARFGIHLKATTTHIRIPERSFLRAGSVRATDDVVQKAREFVPEALLGNVDVETLFEMLGLELKGKIQEYAINLTSPANGSLTIGQKGSSNPLVDTGNMIQSMEVIVE